MIEVPFRRTPATLEVLRELADGEEHYALQITNATGRPGGTVVPLLRRLEEHGWVTSHWEDDTPGQRGPRRRYYQLNPQHLKKAREITSEENTNGSTATG